MYTVNFVYSDGTIEEYPHIDKLKYTQYGVEETLTNDEILTHEFPLTYIYEFHLFAKNEKYTIRKTDNINKIKVSKEED